MAGSTYLVRALREAGHKVFSVGQGLGGNDLSLDCPVLFSRLMEELDARGFTPQALLYSDDGNIPWLVGVEAAPFPTVFFAIDTHCNPWHVPFANAFDYTLVAQQGFVPLFKEAGHRAEWFPLFAPGFSGTHNAEEDVEAWLAKRDIPIAFVGTLDPKNNPARLPFLKAVKKYCPLLMVQGPYEEIFHRARIVLNQSIVGEVNFRCFEAMDSGAALLHDSPLHGFSEIFMADSVLPLYPAGDAEAAGQAAMLALEQPDTLARLALRGKALVQQKHSAPARAAHLTGLLTALLKEEAHGIRLAELQKRRHFLSTAYATMMLELDEAYLPHKELYKNLFHENVRK